MKSELYKAPPILNKQIAFMAFFFLQLFFFHPAGADSGDSLDKDISWPEFMSRHDMVWERLPVEFREAPWTGNGLIGSMIWYEEDRNLLRMQVFRSDVHDHTPFTQGNAGVARGRFQIGNFYLKPEGKITGCDMKLDLWNAQLKGTIKTAKGTIGFSHFTHTSDLIIATTIEPSAGEEDCRWIWEPAKATTTRNRDLDFPSTTDQIEAVRERYRSRGKWITQVYDPDAHGEPEIAETDGVNYCRQTLKYGGEHATAWKETKNGDKRTLWVSIAKHYPGETGNSGREAAGEIQQALKKVRSGRLKWEKAHAEWWHDYYRKSFVSLNDTRVETVYWTQIYKMACTTRHDRPMMDTHCKRN